MIKIQSKIFLTALIILSFGVQAGLYKGLDEDGNVTYSDTPFKDAEKMTPPSISVVESPKKTPEKTKEGEPENTDKEVETTYKNFKISAPTNGQTIWNVPDLTVAITMTPSLNHEQGHTIWLFMDGKALAKKSRSTKMQIGRADRGQHRLTAQIRNEKNKILKRSKAITVHIKNTVVQRKAR